MDAEEREVVGNCDGGCGQPIYADEAYVVSEHDGTECHAACLVIPWDEMDEDMREGFDYHEP